MSDRVVIQIGTKSNPEQLDFLLLYTKEEGKRLGFEASPDWYKWTPGPENYSGVWSTTNQEKGLGWARFNGQSSIHDNVHYKTVFELQWVKT